MLNELLSLQNRRGESQRLKPATQARAKWAIKSAAPVLSLGVRAASHVDYWRRHADKSLQEGKAATTVRTELNEVAALLRWILDADITVAAMKPSSVQAIHDAARLAARHVGLQVKRFKPMQRPGRVSIDELEEIITDIEKLKSPYKEAAKMMLLFALRATETTVLTKKSIIGSMLFIPNRATKTCADLLIPIPIKYIDMVEGWLSIIEESKINYSAMEMYIYRAGVKWRCHDLRKLFRTSAAVRGEDYLAVELILNHSIKDVPATYIQNAPRKQMRKAIENAIDEYMTFV